MEKEEILAKYRANCADEGEEMLENNSNSYGLITVLSIVVFSKVFTIIQGIERPELTAILIAFVTTKSFHKYKKYHEKKYLIIGMLGAISTVIEMILFVLGV